MHVFCTVQSSESKRIIGIQRLLQINQPLHKLSIKLVVPFLFCMPYLYQILMVISIYIRQYDGKKLAVSLKWHANGATYHQPLHKLPIKLVVPFLFCMPYLYQILMVISIYIRHYDGKKNCVPKMACERRHLNEHATASQKKYYGKYSTILHRY